MWTAVFLAELVLRHALKAAERFLRSLSCWYPGCSVGGRDAFLAAIKEHLRDAALWAKLADALGEDCEATVIQPVSRVRPYVASVPVRWAS